MKLSCTPEGKSHRQIHTLGICHRYMGVSCHRGLSMLRYTNQYRHNKSSALLSCCLLFKVSSADTRVVIHGGDFSYSFHYVHLLWMNLIQLWNINGIELIKWCSTMPSYIGRYLKTKMVNEKTAVFPPTKNFPLRTTVHIFIVTNRISFRKIKIDEWASYSKLIRNVHPWQETVTVQTIYIFFFLTFTSTFTFSHNGAFYNKLWWTIISLICWFFVPGS